MLSSRVFFRLHVRPSGTLWQPTAHPGTSAIARRLHGSCCCSLTTAVSVCRYWWHKHSQQEKMMAFNTQGRLNGPGTILDSKCSTQQQKIKRANNSNISLSNLQTYARAVRWSFIHSFLHFILIFFSISQHTCETVMFLKKMNKGINLTVAAGIQRQDPSLTHSTESP